MFVYNKDLFRSDLCCPSDCPGLLAPARIKTKLFALVPLRQRTTSLYFKSLRRQWCLQCKTLTKSFAAGAQNVTGRGHEKICLLLQLYPICLGLNCFQTDWLSFIPSLSYTSFLYQFLRYDRVNIQFIHISLRLIRNRDVNRVDSWGKRHYVFCALFKENVLLVFRKVCPILYKFFIEQSKDIWQETLETSGRPGRPLMQFFVKSIAI